MCTRHPRGGGREADRQRLHRADRQGAPDGVRGRDEPADRAADGGLHWLSPRRSSCRPSRAAPAGSSPTWATSRSTRGRRRRRTGPASTPRICSSRRRARSSSCRSTALRPTARRSRRTVPIVLPLSVARERHPELVEPHLGTIVADDDVFTALNASEWEGGAFVYVPKDVRVEAPILLTAVSAAAGTILHRRVLIVLEEGAQAEVWEQYVSGGDDATVLNTVVELRVGQNAHLRYVCGQELNERSWIFGAQRAEVARDGALDWVALGFGSARGRVRMETLLAGPGRRREGHRRVRAARAPARRLRHDAGARRAEHDVRPRVPRHPRRPLERRLARHDQGRPGRAADRRVPGLPQPAAVEEGARRRDPGPRDPRQRRPLHPRRGRRADRQGAAVLPALARARPATARRGS